MSLCRIQLTVRFPTPSTRQFSSPVLPRIAVTLPEWAITNSGLQQSAVSAAGCGESTWAVWRSGPGCWSAACRRSGATPAPPRTGAAPTLHTTSQLGGAGEKILNQIISITELQLCGRNVKIRLDCELPPLQRCNFVEKIIRI